MEKQGGEVLKQLAIENVCRKWFEENRNLFGMQAELRMKLFDELVQLRHKADAFDSGCENCRRLEKRITELKRYKTAWDSCRALVAEQAMDEGLWFVAATAPEGYLQQELRRLHTAIEAAAKEQQS